MHSDGLCLCELPRIGIDLKGTIKGKNPTNLCAPHEFLKEMCRLCLVIIKKSCYFDCRINKFCVSCSVHLILTYFMCKGS